MYADPFGRSVAFELKQKHIAIEKVMKFRRLLKHQTEQTLNSARTHDKYAIPHFTLYNTITYSQCDVNSINIAFGAVRIAFFEYVNRNFGTPEQGHLKFRLNQKFYCLNQSD